MAPPENLQAVHNRGMACLDKGDFAGALTALRTVMIAIPGNEEISRALRRLARAAGNSALQLSLDSDEAIALYHCSLDAYLAMNETIVHPVDCSLLRVVSFNLGAYYHRLQRFPEAIQHYQDAMVLGPDHIDTPINLARIFTEMGRAQDAVEVLNTALKIHPNEPSLLDHKKRAVAMAVPANQAGKKAATTAP